MAATALIGVLAGLFFVVVLEPLGLGLLDIAWQAHELILTQPLTPN